MILWCLGNDVEISKKKKSTGKLPDGCYGQPSTACMQLQNKEKINWLASSTEGHVFVADESNVISVYQIKH